MKRPLAMCLALIVSMSAAGAQSRPAEFSEDFEDPVGPGVIYEGWEKVASDSHPPYNEIRLIRDPRLARSGDHFILLRTLGGNTAFRTLPRKAWKVEPDRLYRFSAWARLAGTRRNAASATLWWLNRRFEPIGETTSRPLAEPGAWRELVLDGLRAPQGAAWAGIRLNFEGPDVRGECSFDRLAIALAVRLEVKPVGRRLFLYTAGEAPRFEVSASGLSADARTLTLTLTGSNGIEVRRSLDLRANAVTIEFPAPVAGAYTLSAAIGGATRREFPLLVSNRWISSRSLMPPFGASFNPFTEEVENPAELVRWAGFRRAKVTLWDNPPPARGQAPSPEQLFDFLQRVTQAEEIHVTGVLARPPRELFPDVTFTMAELLGSDRARWEKPLRAAVARYRELVPSWQLGIDDGVATVATEDLLKTSAGTRSRTLAAGPPAELLQRLIQHAASESRADPAYIPLSGALANAEGHPLPSLLALRAANDVLAGAVPRAPLQLFEAPIREAAFEKGGRIVLALWSESGEAEREVQLGPDAVLYPPLGAIRPVIPGERLRLGPIPVFILNADPFFLESQAALQVLDPDTRKPDFTLPLRTEPTPRLLRFRNVSWEKEITDVRVRLEGPVPAGWIVKPLSATLPLLGRGQEFTRELSFMLPTTEIEREQELRFEIRFRRDGAEHVLHATRRILIVSPIAIRVSSAAVPDRPNARKVSVQITNGTTREVNLLVRVLLPTLPEQVEPLGRLLPGAEGRTFEYVVHDAHLVDPTRLAAEVIAEEKGQERLHVRKVVPLR